MKSNQQDRPDRIPLTQPSPKGRVCVYRGRDGALRRPRRVQRRNERTIDFAPSIPRLNGAGTAQRAVSTTCGFGYTKQVQARRFGLSNAHNREAVELYILCSIKKHRAGRSDLDEFNRIRGWFTTLRFLRVSPGAMQIDALRASSAVKGAMFKALKFLWAQRFPVPFSARKLSGGPR